MAIGKTLVGLGTVAALGIPAGLYITGVIGSYDEIPWRPLSEDTEFTSTNGNNPYDNKWGKKYARYLLGVGTVSTNAKAKDNVNWWNIKFELLKNDNLTTGKFKGAKRTTETGSSDKTLSQICNEAYKTETTKVKTSVTSHDTEFDEGQVWKYCSVGGTKIKTIKEANNNNPYNGDGSSQKYGKTYEEKLIDIDNNDWFWQIRLQDLISQTSNPATTNSKFHIQNYKEMTLEHIKDTCKLAYSQAEGTSNDQYPKADVFKFCSLAGQEKNT